MIYIRANGSVKDINAHASSPQAAALYFSQKYERPNTALANNARRIASAEAVALAAKSGKWPSAPSSPASTSSGSDSADSIAAFSQIADAVKAANALFKDVAEVVNWAVVMAEPSQEWRIVCLAVAGAAAYGSVRFHSSSFPLSVGLLGGAIVFGYMAFRPWPVSSSNTPERLGPYAVDVVSGNPPEPGPAPSSHVGEIQAGLEALAAVWAAGQAAKGLGNAANLASGVGSLWKKIAGDIETGGEDAAESA
jgi:hypothetical protein